MRTVPESEIRYRTEMFRARVAARGLRGALVTSKVDRFYLTGTVQEGLLWVDAAGDPRLFVLRDVDRARRETPLEVVPVGSRRELTARARELLGAGSAGITLESLSVADLLRLGITDLTQPLDVTSDLLRLRGRKSPWEVERMEEAGKVAAEVFLFAAEILRPGLTEADLGGQLFAKAMSLGHEGLLRARDFEAYSWHILSGPNTALRGAIDTPMSGEGMSPAFPWGAGRRAIQKGEPIIVDFGTSVFGYQTDQTRTFCLGEPPAWLAEAHASIAEIHRAMLDALRPGAVAGEVFALGEQVAARLGLDGYLGAEGSRCRFVGHGVGVEIVEPPLVAAGSRAVLEASNTVAMEPKAVVAGLGGLGVEDTVLVEEGAARPLSLVPLELIVV